MPKRGSPRYPTPGPACEERSLIHISEPTRLGRSSYAVFCLKKKILELSPFFDFFDNISMCCIVSYFLWLSYFTVESFFFCFL